jgi:hypothetical protein
MMMTTCCIGLGMEPLVVVTEVRVPVLVKREVREPEEFVIVKDDKLSVDDVAELAPDDEYDEEIDDSPTDEVISTEEVEVCRNSYPEITAITSTAAITAKKPALFFCILIIFRKLVMSPRG